jgi:hypothetical protein
MAGSVEGAEALLESLMLHLVEPDPTSAEIATHVLHSVAAHTPNSDKGLTVQVTPLCFDLMIVGVCLV